MSDKPMTPVTSTTVTSPAIIKVAIIEDRREIREALGMLIGGTEGFRLTGSYRSMEEALPKLAFDPPQVVLLDIGLPGMTGYEVAQAIRAGATLKHVVLVALTGYGRAEDKARAMAAGFDYHLVKPVDLDTLGSLVSRVGSPEAERPKYDPRN